MTFEEKLGALTTAIAPDIETEDVLTGVLLEAEALILNRMYPFGYNDGVVIPQRYERLQIRLATELYTQRGAEGQASHTENGTTRTWSQKSQLLAQITPHVGSVVSNA